MTKEVDRRLAALESQAAERARRAQLTSSPYTPDEAYRLMCEGEPTPLKPNDTRTPMQRYLEALDGPNR